MTPINSPAPAERLAQTRQLPPPSGPAFEARASALWEAIVADAPERAANSFFPMAAYEQVKDITAPAADWRHRLFAAYAHDIHLLHVRLGDDVARARLLRIDVPEERARWVEPGEEYNKVGYYRVFGSTLRYRGLGGPEKTFEIKSLISWRGEWYVVHLSTIK